MPVAPTPEWRLPSRNARIGGGTLAVVTALFAMGTGIGAFDEGLSSTDMTLRLAVAVFLAILAIVMAALSLAPAWTRNLIVRVRGASSGD